MISAIILAAGLSQRMGQPKMLLPWKESTVLQTVIEAFRTVGLMDIVVIAGAGGRQVEELVGASARIVFNPNFAEGEMLGSIQVGLSALGSGAEAAFIGLGDQPQIQVITVLRLLEAYEKNRASIIVPSHENRRGHPWLVDRELWDEIGGLRPPATMRDFFKTHNDLIQYVNVDNPSILADLDTPEDYRKYRP